MLCFLSQFVPQYSGGQIPTLGTKHKVTKRCAYAKDTVAGDVAHIAFFYCNVIILAQAGQFFATSLTVNLDTGNTFDKFWLSPNLSMIGLLIVGVHGIYNAIRLVKEEPQPHVFYTNEKKTWGVALGNTGKNVSMEQRASMVRNNLNV